MATTIEELKKLKAEYEAKLASVGKDVLKDAFAHLWTAHPEVKRVRWTQYTPYFNDGEECVFSVNVDYPDIDFGEGLDRDTYISRTDPRYPTKQFVSQVISTVPEDLMKAVFGDHVEVTADPNGFEVESYNHE